MHKASRFIAIAVFAVVAFAALAVAGGFIDTQTAVTGALLANAGGAVEYEQIKAAVDKALKAMEDNVKKSQDQMTAALEEVRKEGTLHGKTNEKLTALGDNFAAIDKQIKALLPLSDELKERMQAVEQKVAKKPSGEDAPKNLGKIVSGSEQYKETQSSGNPKMAAVNVGSFMNVITTESQSTTSDTGQLVQPQRVPGVIMPGLQRLVIRDLLPIARTTSNMIEFVKENVFTNNAGIQGAGSSPSGQYDGQRKAQSNLTFTLANVPVRTIAHWIPASRQILADAGMLEGYVNQRLTYGVKLEEEDQFLNGDGSAGAINGLMNQASQFTGGATNQTALDTLLKAFLQVMLAKYEATGVVLHPTDWTNIALLKDTQGRYLFSDPQAMTQPRVWGKPVVTTESQTLGQFLTGAFTMGATIWDREDASVRIAEQHEDFFVRNMVVILAEERVALAVYRPTAFVKGGLSYAG